MSRTVPAKPKGAGLRVAGCSVGQAAPTECLPADEHGTHCLHRCFHCSGKKRYHSHGKEGGEGPNKDSHAPEGPAAT